MVNDGDWDNELPAWRVTRLRQVVAEAFARGENPDDDGSDISHRALMAAFRRGRARWSTTKAVYDRSMEACLGVLNKTMTAAEADAISGRARKWLKVIRQDMNRRARSAHDRALPN